MLTLLRTLARRPQTLWLRRAAFQVHLWTGLAAGLYIIVVCLSGSAIVYRREMDLALCPQIIQVSPAGPRLSDAQLAAAASRAARRRFPQGRLEVQIRGPRVAGAAVEVWLYREGFRAERLLDPYTGRDLGDAVACEPKLVSRIAELHDNLLGGWSGRTVNGAGSIVVLLMCLTGATLWWPGVSRWRRSLTLRWNVPARRFIWDLHSALGFWTFLLILMWALSGIYLGFPGGFSALEDALAAHGGGHATLDAIDTFTEWLADLHFGRAFGPWVKLLWVILGLAPVALLVTGTLMWWNRVLRRPAERSSEIRCPPVAPAVPAVGTKDTAAG
jgi:uncharacterized iron-regulated membrane protein